VLVVWFVLVFREEESWGEVSPWRRLDLELR